MAINTIPSASSFTPVVPAFASSLVLSGKVTDGFYDYNTPLAAGTYILQTLALDTSTTSAYAYAVSNNVTATAASAGTTYFQLTTTESSLLFRPSTVTPTTFTSRMGVVPTNGGVRGVKYSNGKYYIANFNSTAIVYHSDGLNPMPGTWSSWTLPANLLGIDYYAGTWVAYCTNGNIYTSTNGTSTTYTYNAILTQAATYGTVRYLNGKWHVGTDRGGYFTSTDGVTWTAISRFFPYSTGSNFYVAYGAGVYAAAGPAGQLSTSTDNFVWSYPITALNASANFGALRYENSGFIGVGASGRISVSTDAVTWTSRTSGFGNTNINAVAFGNGIYVAAGNAGILTTSTDTITWTTRTSGFGTTNINALTYGNGIYVAAGDTAVLKSSTDAVTWTNRTSGFGTSIIRGLGYGNGVYIAVGDGGTIRTSTDATTWTTRTSGTTLQLNSAEYLNSKYYVMGNGTGAYLTSTDGITWTSLGALGIGTSQSITKSPTYFVAGGTTGYTTYSTDGITWNSSPNGFNATSSMQDIAYGNSKYVALTGGSRQLYSTDGLTWVYQNSISLQGVVFGNSKFLAVGPSCTNVWTSTDGITWTQQTSLATIATATVINDVHYSSLFSRFYIATNYDATTAISTILSTDGITWTQWGSGNTIGAAAVYSIFTDTTNIYKTASSIIAAFPVGDGSSSGMFAIAASHTNFLPRLAYGNGMYVAADYGGVYISTTASNWIPNATTTSNLFGNSYNINYGGPIGNKQFMLDTNVPSNTWAVTSSDGITWTRRGTITGNTQTGPLWCGGTINLWRIGTSTGTTPSVGIYYSTDGATWTFDSNLGASPSTVFSMDWNDNRGFIYCYLNTVRAAPIGGTVTAQTLSGVTLVGASPTLWFAASPTTFSTSTDNTTWTARGIGATGSYAKIAWGSGTYMIGTTYGEIYSSTDAITWTARTLPGLTIANGSAIRDIKHYNGKFLISYMNAGATASQVWLSTDPTTQPINYYLYSANIPELV